MTARKAFGFPDQQGTGTSFVITQLGDQTATLLGPQTGLFYCFVEVTGGPARRGEARRGLNFARRRYGWRTGGPSDERRPPFVARAFAVREVQEGVEDAEAKGEAMVTTLSGRISLRIATMARSLGKVLVLTTGLTAAAMSASADDRVALVIGNNEYSMLTPLANAVNDALAVTGALEDVGFAVDTLTNASRPEMASALAHFADSLAEDAVALFYFAGHGVQVDGVNYLLASDYTAQTAAGLRLSGVSVNAVQGLLAGARTTLIVLDACRNDPYGALPVAPRRRGFRGETAGLARMDPQGMLIAYAAGAGQLAVDGEPDAQNGLFTGHFVDVLLEPGLTAIEVLREVRRRVVRETGGEQYPAVYDGLLGDFVFRPLLPPPPGRILRFGSSEVATLERSGEHRWTFFAEGGEEILVEANSEAFDTYLEVVGPNERSVGADDDGGEGTDSRLSARLPTRGEYSVIVRGYEAESRGRYSVSLRTSTDPPPPGGYFGSVVARWRHLSGRASTGGPSSRRAGKRYWWRQTVKRSIRIWRLSARMNGPWGRTTTAVKELTAG